MAATIRASIWTGASPTAASAEANLKFNKEDSLSGATTPITIPNSTGTNFSYYKNLGLECTANAGTDLSNKRISHHASNPVALPSGIKMHWLNSGTYTQATSPAADSGSNGATPASYTDISTTATQYDAGPDTTVADGSVNGDYLRVSLGVDNTYAGGAGSAIALPDIIFTYDES